MVQWWRLATGSIGGAVAGFVSGFVLTPFIGSLTTGIVLGSLFGVVVGAMFDITAGSTLDRVFTGAAMAVPVWGFLQVMLVPLVVAGQPVWSLTAMTSLLPSLVGWVVAGGLVGAIAGVTTRGVRSLAGPEPQSETTDESPTKVVILGGGFAGLTAAQRLEKRFGPDSSVQLTLINETNAILFTPMLPEVAAGSLEPTHVSTPLRTSLRRTQVVQAAVTDIDTDQRRITLDGATQVGALQQQGPPYRVDGGDGSVLEYDHLIVALGSEPDYKSVPGVEDHAFDFKTLQDATSLRNHVVDCFERADVESDPATRRALVTFVIAGAGFAGAELAGTLNDFVRGISVFYPNVPDEAVRVLVVHPSDRILPEVSETLAEYALDRNA